MIKNALILSIDISSARLYDYNSTYTCVKFWGGGGAKSASLVHNQPSLAQVVIRLNQLAAFFRRMSHRLTTYFKQLTSRDEFNDLSLLGSSQNKCLFASGKEKTCVCFEVKF